MPARPVKFPLEDLLTPEITEKFKNTLYVGSVDIFSIFYTDIILDKDTIFTQPN